MATFKPFMAIGLFLELFHFLFFLIGRVYLLQIIFLKLIAVTKIDLHYRVNSPLSYINYNS